jgi:hypothetical protein
VLNSAQQSAYPLTEPQPEPWQGQNGVHGMSVSLGKYGRRVHGDSRNQTSRNPKREKQDWLTAQAQKYSALEGAELTGNSQRAFENIRLSRSKISFDALVDWCRRDPDFRAQFFMFCGGKLEIDPEMVAGITRVLNNAARRLHGVQP